MKLYQAIQAAIRGRSVENVKAAEDSKDTIIAAGDARLENKKEQVVRAAGKVTSAVEELLAIVHEAIQDTEGKPARHAKTSARSRKT